MVDEAFLIEELRRGSDSAFSKLYYMYAPRLYAYCLGYCKCREDAEEIVEDVFVRLWRIRESIRQNETLRSILFILAKRQIYTAFVKRAKSPEYAEYVETLDVFASDSTDSGVSFEMFMSHLNAAIDSLPATQRNVVRMSKLECMKNREIAEALNLSEQTVKNQLSLGLKELRVLLKPYFPALLFYVILS